jgi:hypothetical protein
LTSFIGASDLKQIRIGHRVRREYVAGIIDFMTQLDVLYRYGVAPTEASVLAMAKMREVYGVRHMALDEAKKTVRIEYDASRLTEPVIYELLRRAGLDIVETMPMFAPPPPPEPVAAT